MLYTSLRMYYDSSLSSLSSFSSFCLSLLFPDNDYVVDRVWEKACEWTDSLTERLVDRFADELTAVLLSGGLINAIQDNVCISSHKSTFERKKVTFVRSF